MTTPHIGSYAPHGAFGRAGVVLGSQTLGQTTGGNQLVTIQRKVDETMVGPFGPAVLVTTELRPTQHAHDVVRAAEARLPQAVEAQASGTTVPASLEAHAPIPISSVDDEVPAISTMASTSPSSAPLSSPPEARGDQAAMKSRATDTSLERPMPKADDNGDAAERLSATGSYERAALTEFDLVEIEPKASTEA